MSNPTYDELVIAEVGKYFFLGSKKLVYIHVNQNNWNNEDGEVYGFV
jgi:hypothetical protein